MQSRWPSSLINCRAYSGTQTSSEYRSDHLLVHPCLRLCTRAARAPENFQLELLNRFEGLAFNEDASPEDKWRDPKDAVSDASQADLERTRRRRRA